MLDYSPMWETMQRKGITQYRLLKSGIDNITLLTLEKICTILECTPNDVVRFRK